MEIRDLKKLQCDVLNYEGNGVCKDDDFIVFVDGILPGEEALVEITKVTKTYATGIIKELLKTTPNRQLPKCSNFEACGGCHLMHLKYEKQLEYKKQILTETLKRIGNLKNIKVDEVIGMENPYHYRNKVQIPFGINNNKVTCGFYKKNSHDIVPLEECYINPRQVNEIAILIKNLCNEYRIKPYDEKTKSGSIRHIMLRCNKRNEYLLVLITKDEIAKETLNKIITKTIEKHPNIIGIINNINRRDNNVILGETSKLLYGQDTLTETLDNIKYELSHQSFFQTNYEQTLKMYTQILNYVNPTKDDIIIDAYSGIGSITLMLAQKAKKVYGIEAIQSAIDNANNNKKINKIKNVEFILGKVEDVISNTFTQNINKLVIDPPRKGCDKQVLDKIIESNIDKIVYVSCNPATLARDLDILKDKYTTSKITLVDMFPHTNSIESIVLLERIK